jgi:hypothetical protein
MDNPEESEYGCQWTYQYNNDTFYLQRMSDVESGELIYRSINKATSKSLGIIVLPSDDDLTSLAVIRQFHGLEEESKSILLVSCLFLVLHFRSVFDPL